jgi:lambda family phage portal protein
MKISLGPLGSIQIGKPKAKRRRMYESARPSRLTAGWQSTTSSADTEINSSLTSLRGRARSLGRDSAYAKRAREIVVNNVIGTGMGLQAQVRNSRGELHRRANAGIEEAWERWSRAENCHTGGALHFADLERLLMAEVFEAGEVFVRMHERPFGELGVPFAIEVIESERVPHEFQQYATSANTRMGIEVDGYFRPVAYWVRDQHPNDVGLSMIAAERVFRVPAEQMIHLRVIDRWPQTRGVPWVHAAAKNLNDQNGYSDAEITAARGAANYMAHQETSDLDDPDVEEQEDGTYQTELTPGIITRGPYKMDFFSPNRPNAAFDPFMRSMLRQVAAGIGVSYESLSRDYSQSNYSSSRLALLDDRDLWRVLQGWFIRSFRDVVHRRWLPQALAAGAVEGATLEEWAVDPEKFSAVKYKPRGWSWIDPTKEVEAFKEAVRCGFTTRTNVIAQSGGGMDREDVDEERRQELDDAAELDLEYDTDPGAEDKPAVDQPVAPPDDAADDDAADDDEPMPMRVVK